jgi:hypothetical protein
MLLEKGKNHWHWLVQMSGPIYRNDFLNYKIPQRIFAF